MFSRGRILRCLTRLATFGEINHPQCFVMLGQRQARWTIKGVDLFLEGGFVIPSLNRCPVRGCVLVALRAGGSECHRMMHHPHFCCSGNHWNGWVMIKKDKVLHLEFGFNVFREGILIEAKMWMITLMFQIIFFFLNGLNYIQMLNKTNIFSSYSLGLNVASALPQAVDWQSFWQWQLSGIMYCKWIKLMHPSPLCCRTVFISLIYIHKSYSVSQLNLLCRLAEWKMQVPCNNRPPLVWWADIECVVYYLHLYGSKALPCQ